jgi:hypothetical protein
VLSDRYCGGGRFCREGWYCSGGGCRSRAADAEAEAARRRQQALEDERRRLEDEARRRADEQRLNEERRRAEAKQRAAEEKRKADAAADRARRNSTAAKASPCSTITGPGMTSGGPCPPTVKKPTTANQKFDAARAPRVPTPGTPRVVVPKTPRVVVLSPPQCIGCDFLKAAGEVLPDFGERLDGIEYEEIKEPPPFDRGANTPPPLLPRRLPAAVTKARDAHEALKAIDGLLETIDDMDLKDIADRFETLSDLLGDKPKEGGDYAKECRSGFIDAAWIAIKEDSYFEKVKAAKDSLKNCWKATVKHIKDTLTRGLVDPATSLEDIK